MNQENTVRDRVIQLFDEIDSLRKYKMDYENRAEEAAKEFRQKARRCQDQIAEKQSELHNIQQGVYLPSDNQPIKVEDKPQTEKTRAECILEIFRSQPSGTRLRSKDILRYLKEGYGIEHANITPTLKGLKRRGSLLQDENKGPYTLATKGETEQSQNDQQKQDPQESTSVM